jgi:transcriptional regulator with GAF, ATPase, and Fis domain
MDLVKRDATLRLRGEHFVQVLDSVMVAIVSFNSSMCIELFNREAEEIFQCPRGEALGGSVRRFLTDGLREALDACLAKLDHSTEERLILRAPGGLLAMDGFGRAFSIDATISCAKTAGGNLYTLALRKYDGSAGAEKKIRELDLHNDYLQEEINATHNIDEIVGRSPALRAVLDQVNLVATTDSTVLLQGETGTGKELIARAIHSRSFRKNRPLIKVDCAALPAGLVDSRLFGHERGAFTGAIKQRIGRFELANGGSILLDEIGDMPGDTQAKLLRVLQEREVERLGGHSVVKVDVRVIAATNRDLHQMVESGTFREDLYYRLNVFPLRVPALREHPEDIPLLVHHFLARYASKLGRQIPHVPSQIMDRFLEYSWPGNVRELENVVQRAVIVSNGPDLRLAAGSLSPSTRVVPIQNGWSRSSEHPSAISENAEPTALLEIEHNHILNILRRTGWRIEGLAGAAHALNLKPSTLRSRMKKFGINRSSG